MTGAWGKDCTTNVRWGLWVEAWRQGSQCKRIVEGTWIASLVAGLFEVRSLRLSGKHGLNAALLRGAAVCLVLQHGMPVLCTSRQDHTPGQLPIRRDGRRNKASKLREECAAASDAALVFEIVFGEYFTSCSAAVIPLHFVGCSSYHG